MDGWLGFNGILSTQVAAISGQWRVQEIMLIMFYQSIFTLF